MDIKWQAQNHKCCLWVMIFWNTCNGKFFGKQRKGGKAGTEEKREKKRPQISLCRIQWYFPRSSLLKPVSIRKQNRNWLQLKVYCHCQKNHKARLGKNSEDPYCLEWKHASLTCRTDNGCLHTSGKKTNPQVIFFFFF